MKYQKIDNKIICIVKLTEIIRDFYILIIMNMIEIQPPRTLIIS